MEDRHYDGAGRLTRIGAAGPGGGLNSQFAYGYDAATDWTTLITSTVNAVNGGNPQVQTFAHNPEVLRR